MLHNFHKYKSLLKTHQRTLLIATGTGLSALSLGAGFAVARYTGILPWSANNPATIPQELNLSQSEQSKVFPFVSLPAAERAEDLQAIAQSSRSMDQFRARYLLASDLIQQNQGEAALEWLDGLEQDYTVLAPAILAKRAQAYMLVGDQTQASATWTALFTQYPDDPSAAEALYALGKENPTYWDQAIAQFPAHPVSIQIAQARLQNNPNDLAMLRLISRHGLYLNDIDQVLDRLSNEFASQLTPEDWEAIGFAYWEMGYYGSAGRAYGKAPATPLNLYRTGRGAQLGERKQDAIAAYQRLVQAFPTAEETSLALLRLSRLVSDQETALTYADQIIQQFPDDAAEAMVEKANILERLNSPQSASQARQTVLTQYSTSEAAGDLRWTLIEQRFKAGDVRGAWELARELVKENPDHDHAPEAAFWIGKWSSQIGQDAEAKTTFEYVLTHYPHSYYAWRSASYLGWDVGDFTTVRYKTPQVAQPVERALPPAGSPALQELYLLGQDRDAWNRWQVEFQNFKQPTVAEQFTDGLMRLGVGDNLDGIFMVSSLSNREKPEEQEAYQALKQQTAYWQALYPFPFSNPIQAWSAERQLNPVLVTGLIRQESRFEPEIVSSAGARGLMQVMPGTADWIAQQAGFATYDLNKPDDNIKLGTWYLDYTHEEYSDNSLFAVASYNAGPGNIADWIDRFGFTDPDLFVEQIPFPETKGYVESVFENYWNYLRLYNPEVSKQLAQQSPKHAEIVSDLIDREPIESLP